MPWVCEAVSRGCRASHRYIAQRTSQLLGRYDLRIISCHLGGSNSLCAIRGQQSVATTMGLSPQTGLPHNNRVGDFDPFAIPLIMQAEGLSLHQVLDTLSEREAGVVSIFVSRLLAKQKLTIFGDGRQTRDYVFVRDVARANVLASTAAIPPGGDLDAPAINIATGTQRSVLELAESVGQVMGMKPELEFAPPRPGELFRSSLAIGKAKAVMGWAPEVPFDDGLRALIEWFRQEAR